METYTYQPHFAPALQSEPQTVHAHIHRLPPELVIELARWVEKSETRLRDLIRLTQVCQRWRTLLCAATTLWSSINAAEGAMAVSRAFQLVGDAPLDLEFRQETGGRVRDAFFELAGKRVQQWRTLVVDFTQHTMSRFPPGLDTCPSPASAAAVHLSRAGNSGLLNLEEISLTKIAIDIATLHLIGLKLLTLRSVPDVTPAAVFDILFSSPSIEIIELQDLSSLTAWSPTSSDPPNSRLSLARLRQLSLTRLNTLFNLFLSLIEAPQLRMLSFDVDFTDDSPAQLLCDQWCRQVLLSNPMTSDVEAPEVVIVFNLPFVRYKVKVGGVDMTIVKVGSAIHHLQECFDWISNAVGQPLHHAPLTLELHGCPVKQHHLEWLTRHAIVTKLILSGVEWSDNLRRIFRSLGRPTTSMPVTWLFPALEILEMNLVWAKNNPELVEMLTKRYSSPANDAVTTPIPLREIRLSSLTRGYNLNQGEHGIRHLSAT